MERAKDLDDMQASFGSQAVTPRDRRAALVDRAGGTGDSALGLCRHLPEREIVVVDQSEGMLAAVRDKGAYSHLVESIDRFPDREDIAREFSKAGWALAEEHAFVFGVARQHIGGKP